MPGVVKRDATRQPFDESKLHASLQRALQKRPVSAQQIDDAVASVTHRLRTTGEREVSSRHIGELIMEELRHLDDVAYVRFASVYRSFQDVTEFQDEIRRLQSLAFGANDEQMSLLSEPESAPQPSKSRKR